MWDDGNMVAYDENAGWDQDSSRGCARGNKNLFSHAVLFLLRDVSDKCLDPFRGCDNSLG